MSSLKKNLDELQKLAKERTVKTQNIEYDLETLVKKIDKKVIKLDPEYQRNHRWNEETSSKLIESLILNIPVPLIYISQDIDVDDEVDDDIPRYSVIDGQQRLTAIFNFMTNNLPLEGMEVLKPLNGSFYRDLPPFLVRRLEERTIKCLRIDSTLDPQVKYDIFERLNSGSVKLEAQELRNAIYRGPFNKMIKELAKNEDFRVLNQIDLAAPDESKKVQKMEDVELVLRFFALHNNNYKNLKKGFKTFLSESMEQFNKLSGAELRIYSEKFTKTMALIRKEFGDKAFAKYRLEDGKFVKMSNFNAAVYDSLAIAIVDCVDLNNPQLLDLTFENFRQLFADPEFFEWVSGSVNDREKVSRRIEAAKELLTK
ncbi:DUF262 domain-containing protein [Sulfoacidibacillus thermotolerans]|uniref:GmrSD restriction endonucleases N-terminal domain-containing protein n=1 Tax=Sulfoacidibacillus thermotolerans TaxID=1765684 RepID=A0A2U3D8B6_SULT2|nr:DUF262 domain-containing protein [Sulfoacidibacillus thermotolerans]PWI57511.1 hypothetical protein BM613_08565 [Sulfoacidibacillus thermotolerans]